MPARGDSIQEPQDGFYVRRLRQVCIESGGNRPFLVLGIGIPGESDEVALPKVGARVVSQSARQRVAVLPRHADVRDDEVGLEAGRRRQSRGDVTRHGYRMTVELKE